MEDINKTVVESILFAAGRQVEVKEFALAIEKSPEEVIEIVEELKSDYNKRNAGIDIIRVNDSYQMCTRKKCYEFVAQVLDRKNKPNLTNASLEIISIIAYNPNITRAQIETIRGVNSDGTLYKLLEYELIKESGKLDAPGKPTTYAVADKFYKMFGLSSLEELPELPKYKLDQNQQIVIDEEAEENV
ncbi:MAG: SMC-Scp complex subunit ScpB [Clostridia bacterium]|nr:SMC-Scp complex subunit ScpB [Clostridia bacterium]